MPPPPGYAVTGEENTTPSAGPSEAVCSLRAISVPGRGSQATAELPWASGGTKQDVLVCERRRMLVLSLAGPSNMLSQTVCAQQH
ncbi:hypothetical protein CesoFtcFv8_013276 [Champsocephalus esox]|uniref:Uncharacterized protein n=1 Tax=Champsocephalus esox TaxID=159716 RepID=A0AAN8BX72_9TELE|nr:hypothetical protein CesoFtcFv8_013276 [Champsocephalus esox]